MTTTYYITTALSGLQDALEFTVIPTPVETGVLQSVPFTVSISAFDNGPHVIDLYAQYSNSQPYQQPQNKWGHLVPQWRFLDTDLNIISQIVTEDTPLSTGNTFIGVTGQASFYYVDDMPSLAGFPAILWATMQVSGLPLYSESHEGANPVASYANSKVIAYTPYFVNGSLPDHLEITRDGIMPLSAGLYWKNHKIPNIINVAPVRLCSDGIDGLNILFDVPYSNQEGLDMGPVTKAIAVLPVSSQQWIDLSTGSSDSYFQRTDKDGYYVGGYVRNTVKTDFETTNANITASIGLDASYYVISADTAPYTHIPYIWVSDPNNNLLRRVACPQIDSSVVVAITSWLFSSFGVYSNQLSVPYLTATTDFMSLTGFGGIYGIAVDPCYNIWCADAEMDKLYKFNWAGTLLSTIDLELSGTPSDIVLDSTLNMYIPLYGNNKVMKYDKNGIFQYTLSTIGDILATDVSLLSNDLFKPVMVETDSDDNVWTTYNQTLCSFMYKHDSTGIILSTIAFPLCSNPMDVLVDYDNNVWVSLAYQAGPPYFLGAVQKYNGNTGALVTSVSSIHPEYLTMDKTGNIWFTFEINGIGKIDKTTYSLTTATLGSYLSSSWFVSSANQSYNMLEGLAADSNNRIWVINAYDQNVYVLSGGVGNIIKTINLSGGKTGWYLDSSMSILSLSSEWFNSLQANGDWTGYRWLQKYNSSITNPITGDSGPFVIDSIQNYDLRKFNESWDATTQIRDYALPEHFYNDYNLFVNYIGTMIGGLETSAHSIARKIYERYANYVANHSDVDTCNIHQLYSLAQEINVPADNYDFSFPDDLKRIMDIVSISQRKLWGGRCICNLNFKFIQGLCENCGHSHPSNIGAGLNTDTYSVSTDVSFLAEYKFSKGKYEVITPISNYSSIYNVASTYLLSNPQDYCYFEHIPTVCDVQNEGVVNWEDEYTTLNETISSLEKWYSTNETVEKLLSYYIHQGLGFSQ